MKEKINSKFILIDKDPEITSRKACNFLQKKLNVKKIGHSGTLDPFATGLLIIGIGNATKLFPFIGTETKTYTGTFLTGVETDTLDITGNITNKNDNLATLDQYKNAIPKFLGKIMQRVPDYSASKVNGTRRYKLAREGKKLDDKYVEREIYSINIFKKTKSEFSFECVVSNGTYIRQLIYDISKSIGIISTLTSLRREKIGNIDVSDANKLEEKLSLLPVSEIVNFEKVLLNKEKEKLQNGGFINLDKDNEYLFACDDDGEIYSLLERKDDYYKVKKLL
ncbi:MAG: tRNA pseudouridine(55) synthase TruB [Mycoplasmataceae bacterium]|nr:tRNA pseudouridine(55) synthase TruB [Mycoplasmataceae bacterium]